MLYFRVPSVLLSMTAIKSTDCLQSNTDNIEKLQSIGHDFHRRGWSLATSSNYSIVISKEPLLLLMTASGKDKGSLCPADFAIVDENTKVVQAAHPSGDSKSLQSSAEAALHIAIAQTWQAGSVLHTHSVFSTVLSEKHAKDGALNIKGLEMLKALSGVRTHDTSISIPIFENNQDMSVLASIVKNRKDTISHAFLLRGHGLYTWGTTFEEAKRHTEALEFLLEVTARSGGLA